MIEEELIASLDDYPEDGMYELLINKRSLLLIIKTGNVHLIENKCGHFGVPFVGGNTDGSVNNNEIICAEHGLSFDLNTGEIVNRPYENCDPITIFPLKIIDNKIYLSKIII
jgi:nitrite reductase/ring-hydroxylating ferredoxin subunit